MTSIAGGSSCSPDSIARSAVCEELPDGLRWRFAPEDGLLAQIATVIDAERRCCRFLRFEVIVEPNGARDLGERHGSGQGRGNSWRPSV